MYVAAISFRHKCTQASSSLEHRIPLSHCASGVPAIPSTITIEISCRSRCNSTSMDSKKSLRTYVPRPSRGWTRMVNNNSRVRDCDRKHALQTSMKNEKYFNMELDQHPREARRKIEEAIERKRDRTVEKHESYAVP